MSFENEYEDHEAKVRAVTLNDAEAAKLRAVSALIFGEDRVAEIEQLALRNALEAGYDAAGYESRRAPAPLAVDIMFALAPERL